MPPMPESKFRVVVDCTKGVFALRGALDQSSAEGLRATVAAARLPIVVLDVSELRSIDDAGIACIAAAAQHHSAVVLQGLRPEHDALVAVLQGRPGFILEGRPPDGRPPFGSRDLRPHSTRTEAHPMTSVLGVSGLGPITQRLGRGVREPPLRG
jgi:anti-anti-sigma regulatory factor